MIYRKGTKHMKIESKELRASIARQLVSGYEPLDVWYNKGLITALKMIELHEQHFDSDMDKMDKERA
jgi:hypothetical protein